jgi:hypothetical protein
MVTVSGSFRALQIARAASSRVVALDLLLILSTPKTGLADRNRYIRPIDQNDSGGGPRRNSPI